MGALLESGMVGNIGLKHLKVIREDTISKWDKLGFLNGLKGHGRENIAQLYENQATHLINEQTSSNASGSFETVVFPIIRRVFSKLLANDIVSVQAMNLPIGKLFYFVPKISNRNANNLHTHTNPVGSGLGNDATTYNNVNLYDQFYEDGQGLFDASKGAYSAMTRNTAIVVWGPDGTLVSGRTDNVLCSAATRTLLLAMTGFNNAGAGKLIGPTGNEMDTEEFLASLSITSSNAITCCNYDVGNSTTVEVDIVDQYLHSM